jgi:WD40 repeat protein
MVDGRIEVDDSAWSQAFAIDRAHAGEVTCLLSNLLGPHGLASAGSDRVVKLWDLDPVQAPARPAHTCTGHTGAITGLAFKPDDSSLASASEDGTVRIWDVKTGKNVFTFKEHRFPIHALAWDYRSGLLASANEAVGKSGNSVGVVHLWEPQRGTILATLNIRRGAVLALAFHPEADQLALGCADGTVRVWRVRPWHHFVPVQAAALIGSGMQGPLAIAPHLGKPWQTRSPDR